MRTVIGVLTPLQRRYAESADDPTLLARILADGAEQARQIAAPTLRAAKAPIGLLATTP